MQSLLWFQPRYQRFSVEMSGGRLSSFVQTKINWGMDGQEIRTDIHIALRINCNHFLDPLMFHLAPSSGQNLIHLLLCVIYCSCSLFLVLISKLPPKDSTTSCSMADDCFGMRAGLHKLCRLECQNWYLMACDGHLMYYFIKMQTIRNVFYWMTSCVALQVVIIQI